jgi:hypothetical protein
VKPAAICLFIGRRNHLTPARKPTVPGTRKHRIPGVGNEVRGLPDGRQPVPPRHAIVATVNVARRAATLA